MKINFWSTRYNKPSVNFSAKHHQPSTYGFYFFWGGGGRNDLTFGPKLGYREEGLKSQIPGNNFLHEFRFVMLVISCKFFTSNLNIELLFLSLNKFSDKCRFLFHQNRTLLRFHDFRIFQGSSFLVKTT